MGDASNARCASSSNGRRKASLVLRDHLRQISRDRPTSVPLWQMLMHVPKSRNPSPRRVGRHVRADAGSSSGGGSHPVLPRSQRTKESLARSLGATLAVGPATALHAMYPPLPQALFKLEPERAHSLTLLMLRLAGCVTPARGALGLLYSGPSTPVTAFGLPFKNRIGLAAGYDKDARAVRGLAALGFGHIEVGTVTPLPQPGNPRPRPLPPARGRSRHQSHGLPQPGLRLHAATAQPAHARQLDRRNAGHPRRPSVRSPTRAPFGSPPVASSASTSAGTPPPQMRTP